MTTNQPTSAISDLKKTSLAIMQEQRQRDEIMNSTEYKTRQYEIERLQSLQEDMLAQVPDSTEEYEADKKEVIAYMLENNIRGLPGFDVKIRKKNSVDTYAVLQAMQGDIDNLMLVASVTQTSLAKFIKDNPGYKRDLRSCIREDGYTITDISLADDDN